MELFYETLQIISFVTLGFGIGKGLIWFGETKVGHILIVFFIWPYILWIFYKLSKDEFLINLQDKIEREKITYYFENS